MIVLVADVGGTHARIALAEGDPGVGAVRLLAVEKYQSAEENGLAPYVRRFLAKHARPRPERACFGVAGPVEGGRAHLTARGWDLDASRLAKEFGVPVRLINDFESVGHALPRLVAEDLVEIQPGEGAPGSAIALVGAGTGLGHAFVLPDAGSRRVFPSEAGHADFAPSVPIEEELLAHLRAEYGHVSWERVVSGPGLGAVYRFLAGRGETPESPAVRAEMAREDAGAVVVRHALAKSDTLCDETLAIFVRAYGAQAGNFALSVRAEGGVYLAGGIAPRIVPRLVDGPFRRAFVDKGRFEGFLSRIPVRVIVRAEVGLVGSAAAALEEA